MEDKNKASQLKSYEKKLEKVSPFEVKSTLISLAEKSQRQSANTFLNAGRGNPNWIMSEPRAAYFLLGRFALDECRATYDGPNGIAGCPTQAGIDKRFEKFLADNSADPAAATLKEIYEYATATLKIDAEALVYEWADGIIGDHYPTPPRILNATETICADYLRWAMGGGDDTTHFNLFATEGSTAGMCYIFDSLQANFLLNKGDKLAILTPAFTPYLEIPDLRRFDFDVVYVSANKVDKDGYHEWQYADEEIDKLRDPSVKAVCVINPSNPPSYELAPRTMKLLADVVKNDNPDLMIITDDVYGTFIKGFRSLMYELPYNTACLYSYSKYFGATGWRLAVMALADNNVFDARLAKLPADQKAVLAKRYSSLGGNVDDLHFVDRLVADSRLVALNHTAGLSTPQQIMMSLFSAYAYLHRDVLQPELISIIQKRLTNLWKTTGFTLMPDSLRAGYYSEIDLVVWAEKIYGKDFVDYLQANYLPIDFVLRLAKETSVVLLNGDGFDGPAWSVRASLANLNADDYLTIGTAIRKILDEYYQEYQNSTKTK